ncbi:MAG: NAD(P)-binding protein [Candidatus Brocadiales bacterium]
MIIEPHQIKSDIEEKVDVCVIGSGAGGAVTAKELAEAGYSVVGMEKGGYYTGTFNNEAQHLGKPKGKCYPECLWKNNTNIYQ